MTTRRQKKLRQSMQALIIPADDTKAFEVIEVSDDISAQVDALQDVVEGMLEAVPWLKRRMRMYVNEEGLCMQLPRNARATAIAEAYGYADASGPLVGNAVVVGITNAHGNMTTLDNETITALIEKFNET